MRNTARSSLALTDRIAATTPPAKEAFTTVRTAKSGEVLRGISFTPGTGPNLGHEMSSILCDFGICKN